MVELLILEGWKEYDDQKKRLNENPRYFRCSEKWEIEFLVHRIQLIYSAITVDHINDAVSSALKNYKIKERQMLVREVVEILENPPSHKIKIG